MNYQINQKPHNPPLHLTPLDTRFPPLLDIEIPDAHAFDGDGLDGRTGADTTHPNPNIERGDIYRELVEMANSQDWDIPLDLLGSVASARRGMQEHQSLPRFRQIQHLANQWPQVWSELNLYNRRERLMDMGRQPFEPKLGWTHDRFEKAAREFDKFSEHIKQVHSRSYLSERDPLIDRPRPVGLKSFLDGNERAGYGWR